MAEIKSESGADFIPESVADFARNTHAWDERCNSQRISPEFDERLRSIAERDGKLLVEVLRKRSRRTKIPGLTRLQGSCYLAANFAFAGKNGRRFRRRVADSPNPLMREHFSAYVGI
jgi:hypothetical protein